jgi:hypothetical protein
VLWAVLVDVAPPEFEDKSWRHEFDHVLNAANLFPGGWHRWIFKHDVVEACTAVKGHALLHLLSQGAEKVIYLDPDIALFNSLESVVQTLNSGASIILTPHQVEPNLSESEIVDNEIVSMQTGVYNLGFLAVRNDAEARKMAKWWAGRLFHACYDDQKSGIFTDQKYCDLIPALFSGVRIERDPGYNVASWNISQRTIEVNRNGDILSNKSLLKFYHFTKVNSDGDTMTERYARNQLAIFEIWNWYKRSIKEMEMAGIPKKYWHYSRFEDGTPIPKTARIAYRNRPDFMAHFPDPFISGDASFQEWFRRHGAGEADRPITTTRVKGGAEVAPPGSVAAIIHVHYPDLLPEIRDLLAGCAGPMKVFITTMPDRVSGVEHALRDLPHKVEIIERENRGRDMLPFIRVLPRAFEEQHDYILKLHTKRSRQRDDGDQWRGELLQSLSQAAELRWVIDCLARRPDVGVVGPLDHLLKMDAYWGSNEATVRKLNERMGVGTIEPDPNVFVAGSMFIARKEALYALGFLKLSDEDFEPEMGQTDGTLAHALERLITFSAAARGLRVAGKPASAAGLPYNLVFGGNLEYRFAPRSDRVSPLRS